MVQATGPNRSFFTSTGYRMLSMISNVFHLQDNLMLRKWDRFTMRQNHVELIELDLETWGTCLHLYVLFRNCHEIIFPLALPTAHIRIIVHGWSNIWPLIKHTPFLRTKWYFCFNIFTELNAILQLRLYSLYVDWDCLLPIYCSCFF
jgi:hypothetical protein